MKLFLDRNDIRISHKKNQGIGNPLHLLLESSQINDVKDDDLKECIDLLIAKFPESIHQRDERQLLPFQVAIISRFEESALKLIALATDPEILTEKAGDYTSLSIGLVSRKFKNVHISSILVTVVRNF